MRSPRRGAADFAAGVLQMLSRCRAFAFCRAAGQQHSPCRAAGQQQSSLCCDAGPQPLRVRACVCVVRVDCISYAFAAALRNQAFCDVIHLLLHQPSICFCFLAMAAHDEASSGGSSGVSEGEESQQEPQPFAGDEERRLPTQEYYYCVLRFIYYIYRRYIRYVYCICTYSCVLRLAYNLIFSIMHPMS